jgi:hypothetical protein
LFPSPSPLSLPLGLGGGVVGGGVDGVGGVDVGTGDVGEPCGRGWWPPSWVGVAVGVCSPSVGPPELTDPCGSRGGWPDGVADRSWSDDDGTTTVELGRGPGAVETGPRVCGPRKECSATTPRVTTPAVTVVAASVTTAAVFTAAREAGQPSMAGDSSRRSDPTSGRRFAE